MRGRGSVILSSPLVRAAKRNPVRNRARNRTRVRKPVKTTRENAGSDLRNSSGRWWWLVVVRPARLLLLHKPELTLATERATDPIGEKHRFGKSANASATRDSSVS